MPEFDMAPALRVRAMPCDTNPSGDVFGGWLLAQMDAAGALTAARRSQGRVVTVGIEAMTFHKPVCVGDEVNCYTRILAVGRTSVRVGISIWVRRYLTDEAHLVTDGVFTYVAIDQCRQPRPSQGWGWIDESGHGISQHAA
ncbi:MAG: acyl-CoA thioesterase [Azospirillum sp.]|nr:acyl-CoA thioesterase [Azospirillum sp.]